MKKIISLSIALVCAASSVAQQKLPCTVADINAVLAEYDKKVLNTSQYILMDINDDGVKDIVFRDSDKPSASYAVILVKNGKLEVENFGYDGYDMLGYGKGGFSFNQHDDHMGMEGRTIDTSFGQYKNGKKVMYGSCVSTTSISESEDEDGGYDDEVSCTINGKEVSCDEYEKVTPECIWFCNIDEGWRMVKNNQSVVKYSHDEYDIYDGEVGEYPVTLCFEKGKHNGFYFYKSRPENKFTLKCVNKSVKDGDTILEVKEYLSDGKCTGTFKGTYSKGSSFSGKFTNYADKTFDFYLSWKF